MENITLETINSSIGQLHHRIDDLNNRVNETNGSMRIFINENNKAHRDIGKQVDQACRLISNVEKKSSVTKQRVEDHLSIHKKDDEKANINGVKLTTLIGNFGSAIIGATAVLLTTGII
jgi:hypothetical protein